MGIGVSDSGRAGGAAMSTTVRPALVAGIHVLEPSADQDVDGRVKRGHDAERDRSGGAVDPPCHVAAPGKQSFDGNILVEFIPMQAGAAQFDLRALSGRRVEEARKPSQRNTERAAITDRDPHGVIVEGDLSWRNGHVSRRQV